MKPLHDDTEPADEPPPFGGSWSVWYGVVLGFLAALVGFFAWITGRLAG